MNTENQLKSKLHDLSVKDYEFNIKIARVQ